MATYREVTKYEGPILDGPEPLAHLAGKIRASDCPRIEIGYFRDRDAVVRVFRSGAPEMAQVPEIVRAPYRWDEIGWRYAGDRPVVFSERKSPKSGPESVDRSGPIYQVDPTLGW